MMKKIIITILFVFVLIPTTLSAATLKDYQNKLQEYKNELHKNNVDLNNIDQKIKNNKGTIEALKNEFIKNQKETDKMQEEYILFNDEIVEKKKQTKKLFEYLQMSNGENLYLEYALGADSMTDFIYRMTIVEQLTDYNKKKIAEIEDLIEKNKQREKDLAKRNEDMKIQQQNLDKQIIQLTGSKTAISNNAISVTQQVNIYQEIVNSYIKQGCKPHHVIGRDCAVTGTVAGFFRPVSHGYITSEAGPRAGGFHQGIDISNKTPYSTVIYPVANGTVRSIYVDAYGALVVVIHHKTIDGKYYTSFYAHMDSFASGLYVGKEMTPTTPIGIMGNTGWSTGPHLHLEIAPCRLFDQTDRNCNTWNNYVAYVQRLYYNGTFKGPRSVIHFPGLRVAFNGR